ncbi:MAG: hypothetical protein ACHQAQ_07495 [Hyphomicrobiales bacterium]
MFPPIRLSPLRLRLAGAALLAAGAAMPCVAVAQMSPECQKGIGLFKARITFIQKIQALPKKHADPVIACSLFSSLGGANARVLAWAKSNKDWCSIEDNQITGLETEAKQVAGIRANACKVAAEYNKLKNQAQAAHAAAQNGQNDSFSVDMKSDPLTPPVKIPPSAL